MLLNESLSRLSFGAFEINNFENSNAPDRDYAEYVYDNELVERWDSLCRCVPSAWLLSGDW